MAWGREKGEVYQKNKEFSQRILEGEGEGEGEVEEEGEGEGEGESEKERKNVSWRAVKKLYDRLR
ncbi:hypothetical protein BOTCAL_0011g00020 [Botryotinia calthae]|uniref:Uncharacterized protein n=1 Tax=Botryotinia calthae TaxID=38488 RepID=A0A4Y8DGC2_9HELO|nr:hypothetical protein BOTCAL_0011g00020 [Botryotinia calthae]